MSTLLIENGTIVTLGEKNQILKNHSVFIENDLIKKIVPDIQKSFLPKADKVINANGKVVMPGFINTHMHFYSTFARGLGKAAPSKNFTEVLENLWWKLDKQLTLEDCYYSTLVACVDAIKKGTTTFIDHHASPYACKGSLKKIADAVTAAGLRASLCYELSDRDGEKIANEGIEENLEFINYCQTQNNDQLRALFGMHASFTIEQKTLENAVSEAKKLNAGFHIHCAEDLSDQEITFNKYGKRVVERLFDADMLGEKTILAHCIHVNDNELDLISKTKSIVVHNPQSNMNNAVGVADINKMISKNILVGLGTDAMTVNMIEELRASLWINHLSNKNPSVGFMECANLLSVNNAKIANRYWGNVGELRENFKADIAILDYHGPTLFDENTFLGHLIFGLSNAVVDTTIASGQILMINKEITILSERKIASIATELSQKLWERF